MILDPKPTKIANVKVTVSISPLATAPASNGAAQTSSTFYISSEGTYAYVVSTRVTVRFQRLPYVF